MSRILRCNICDHEATLSDVSAESWDSISVSYLFKDKSSTSATLDVCPKCSLKPNNSEKSFGEILNVIEAIIRELK